MTAVHDPRLPCEDEHCGAVHPVIPLETLLQTLVDGNQADGERVFALRSARRAK